MKRNSGITLIALVITIIILLILAGVVLSIVFNGGVIDNSQKATEKVRMDSFKEEVTIAMLDRKIERKGTLEESLNVSITGNKTVEVSEFASDICYVTRNGDTITVYENGDIVEGRVSVWNGNKSVPEIKQENGKFNWYIYTAEELKFLADFVNNGKQLNEDLTSKISARNYSASDVVMNADTTVFLMNNIDLGARPGAGATEDEQWAVNSSKNWEPIGADNDTKMMIATFEGNDHIISGVYVNKAGNFAGIFGNSNTINKLTIKNSYIKAEIGVGGIVGALRDGELSNCHNINTIVKGSGAIVSGIAGQASGTVSNCSNSGKIEGASTNVAGIVANALTSCTITGCSNNGEIIGADTSIGGIVGMAQASCTITNCSNNAGVTGQTSSIGGVIGSALTSCTITGCINSGKVVGRSLNVGGISGKTAASCIVTGCINNGEISSVSDEQSNSNAQVAGIIGSSTTTSISECTNNGNISGYANIAGITGYLNSSSTITGCVNNGRITASYGQSGGITGASNSGSVTECINTGSVTADNSFAAGIVGYVRDTTTISKCMNTGNIDGSAIIGGIVGEMNGVVDSCVNSGNVKSKDCASGIGAHVSKNYSATVTNCYNTGTITLEKLVSSANSCGGIFGWVSNTSTSVVIKNNYNIGKIIGSDDVGGVIGHVTSTALNKFDISNNYSLRGCVELKDINNPETVIPETELTVLENEVMEAENMKTDGFVTTLGTDNWTRDSSKNNGYPILK